MSWRRFHGEDLSISTYTFWLIICTQFHLLPFRLLVHLKSVNTVVLSSQHVAFPIFSLRKKYEITGVIWRLLSTK